MKGNAVVQPFVIEVINDVYPMYTKHMSVFNTLYV